MRYIRDHIFLGATIALVVWALFRILSDLRQRASGICSETRQQAHPAEEVLDRRFARGEIGVEEYQQALKILKGHEA